MAPDGRSPLPSTPVLVSLTVLGVVLALPLALIGVATVTGWEVARSGLLEEYWFGLGLFAAVSLFAAPYGAVLGAVTLPITVRTAAGYGTPTEPDGVDRPRDHVAGAVLYATLASFAAGAVLWTVIRLPPGTVRQQLGPSSGVSALLVGSLFVAATFLAAQIYHRGRGHAAVDGGTVAWYSLYATGLVPAPFAALVVLDWLLPLGLLDVVFHQFR